MTDFDPSAKAQQEYRNTTSASNYYVMKSRWLKQQAQNEGVQYKPGWIPKGYKQTWTSQSAQNPGSIYWKPDAYAKFRPDLPSALWDNNKDIQNYWHNPSNVISWHNRFRVQDEDYEPPEGIDKKFIEDQFDALKDFNDDEDDPLYWKPLPLGHDAAYLTNFTADPNGDMPIYRSVIDQLNSPEMLAKRYREYEATAVQNQKIAEQKQQEEIQAIITEASTAKSAQEVLDKLQDKVTPEYYGELKTYYQKNGDIPLDDGTFVQKPLPDYAGLYPWQRGVQTIGSSAEMENRPAASSAVADIVGSLLPAVGVWAGVSQAATIAAATAATGVLTTGGSAAAVTASTGVGLPVGLIIAAGSVLLAGATFLYMMANKDNPANTPVQKIFQVTNAGAEAIERGIGAVQIASDLQADNQPVDWSAAYDAGFLTYEAQPVVGNFLMNLASWASEGVDKAAAAVGIESNLSSGAIAGKDEAWLLDQGFKEPQKVEGGLGVPMLRSAYDALIELGDERNRDDMQSIWGYYTALTGSGGTFNDFMAQSLADPLNFAQALGNKGVEIAATKGSKYYASLPEPDMFRANSLESLAQASRWAQGNLFIDSMPMGIQKLVENLAQGFETKAAWQKSIKEFGSTKTLADFKKDYNPRIHGTWGVGDTLFTYQAMLGTGYTMPGSSEYIIHPGGKAYEAVRMMPFSDGSLKIVNIDGSKTWDYTKARLDALGVKLVTNPAGDLTIDGVRALFKDVGLDTNAVRDLITTSLKWKNLSVEAPDIINAEGADFIDATDPATYVVKKGDNTYTVNRTSDMVIKVVDANGNTVKLDKPSRWGEHPTIIGDTPYSHAEADFWNDLVTITETRRARIIDPDFRSADDVKTQGLRGKLTALNLKGIDAAIDWYTKFSELNPGTKGMIEAENLKENILMLHMLSGNNYELGVRALKKFISGADVGELTKAAEQFIGQATTVVNSGDSMKAAFGDGSMLDEFVQLYRDTAIRRAYITKVAKALDVAPHKLLDMPAETVLKKLTNRLAGKNDETSRLLMEDIASGRLTKDTIAEQMKAFQGKDALPLTDQDFLAMTTMYAEKAVQDHLIEKYGIKKLPTIVRLSGMKKALISPFLIAFPYTTWLNNLWSNFGVQFFLAGEIPMHGKTAKAEMVARLGLDALPWSPNDRMGLASELMVATSKMQLLQNPNDTIGKVTKTLRDFGGIVKTYSKIEEYNTGSLFIAEVMNMHRRIRLPSMPENYRQGLIANGVRPEQIKLLEQLYNGTMSSGELEGLLKAGVEYNGIDLGVIEDAADVLGQGDAGRKAKYTELMQKLGADEEFMKQARQIKNPKDLYLIRDALDTALHKQIAVMMDESVRSAKFEVQNIMTKEGMAGGVKLMSDAIYGELETRLKNSVAWGEAKAQADAAKKVADYATSNRIIRAQRERSKRLYTYFYALQDTQFKAMVDTLKAGDANAKAFIDATVKRHDVARRTMAEIERNYQSYFDAEAEGATAKWEDVVAKNDSLMERLDKSETEALKQIANIWTNLLGSNVASNVSASGISATDLKRGGKAMMKRMIDGYAELNKLRAQHYTDIKDLSGNARRASQMTFWNEVWQPKVGELMAYFVDKNWQQFYKVSTDLEKKTFPSKGGAETAEAPKKPLAPGDQVASNVETHLASRALDESAKANADALHVDAAAEHSRQIWYQDLADKVEMTPSQKAWAAVYMDTFDEVWSHRTGKPAGSWWAEQGTIVARMSTSDNQMKQDMGKYAIEAAAVTRWDEIEKKFDVLINSKKHNASTWLREVDRILFATKLLDDADKAIITRTYGGIELEDYQHIESKVNNHTATPAEVELWRKISDDFTNGHRKWLAEDAFDAAPPELQGVFGRINYAIRTLVNNILKKLRNYGTIPDEVKGVYERLHFLQDVDDRKARTPSAVADVEMTPEILTARTTNLETRLNNFETGIQSESTLRAIAADALELRKAGATPEIDGMLERIDKLFTAIDKEASNYDTQPGLFQLANEVDTSSVWDKKGLGGVPAQNETVPYYGKTRMMKPSEFLSNVPPMAEKGGTTEYLMSAISDGKKLAPPFLEVFWSGVVEGYDAFWKVSGHEGRHRALAFYNTYGDVPMPVFMIFHGEYEKLAKNVTDDMLQTRLSPQSRASNAWDAMSQEGTLNKPGLFQKADEIPTTMPITEYPVGSSPVHQNVGASLHELYQFDIPIMLDTMMDTLTKRMQDSERVKYNINFNEGAQKVLTDYTRWASDQQRQRMASILDGAKRITKDMMIDYSRKRGFDQVLEMVMPFQFWYTRSMMMWLKRMVQKPNVMAMAYRYRELQRRNEMTGFPSRQAGKTPIYAPWLPEELGDWLFVNPGNKFFTPEQLFQPLANFANLDAETTQEAQQYVLDLMRQGTVSAEDGRKAILDKTGNIWEDAVSYVKLNTMSDKTDAFSMASMVLNPDPIMNTLYQFGRGTPEKLSPLPLTRLGNSFEAIGGDGVLGIIGSILSYPEDTLREKAGVPQAGEWGDYYVDFFLSNMAVTSDYSVDEIMKAMISREGAAFEEATQQAATYIAYRTPGTAFIKAIADGHRDPNTLASAFLMSFLPAGVYPEGEMELRGLKDEYSQAWNDYERGDTEALERFNNDYPEYKARQAMFQEPTDRLRGHLINMIWDTYTNLPTANKQIAADSLGDAFKAYFLDTKTRDYNRVDENTLTTWARRLGYQAPATPETQQAAAETVEPMQSYPDDRAAVIQTFLDERNTNFPDFWLYQGVYYRLPESERKKFLRTVPMLEDYWDWKKEYTTANPDIKSYLDDRAAAAGSYDTEYDVQAAQDKLKQFDDKLLAEVIYHQYSGEPLPPGAKAELNTMFQLAGKPGGDFQLWLRVLLGE